jgi:uncharacterized protein YigE (DUF2233 family)
LYHWLFHWFTLSGIQPPPLLRALHRIGLAPLLTPPFVALLSLLSACGAATSLTPSAAPISSEWEQLAPGLERRTYTPGAEYLFASFTALRIDPTLYTFRVHYSLGDPLSLAAWRGRLPDAVAFFNANFFDRDGNALGLLVTDGVVYGQAYTDRGGMLQVQNGIVRVRSTLREPYMGEPLEQAAQAFPMLMTDGAASYSSSRSDRPARRTVVGQDAQGRIVVLASASLVGMRLTDLSDYLASTDLGLINAVNLDGGGSTLLALYPPDDSAALIPSFDPIPVVVAVYPR